MKTNKIMRLASGLLVVAMMTTCAISGTFAKYISTTSGNDGATVAKWSFKVNGEEIAVTGNAKTVGFDLFKTIKDTEESVNESNVKSTLIAPGTSGSFALKVVNLSEVSAVYTIKLEASESKIPLEYSVDGKNWDKSIGNLDGLSGQSIIMGGNDTKTVYWRWVYEAEADGVDTALGVAAQKTADTVTITATITATQVD